MRWRQILIRFLATAAVLAAGTAVVGHAANLQVSSHTLGAVSATLPTCASGSIGVTTTGSPITKVTPKLNSCAGATAGDLIYVTLDDTTNASIGHGTCTLAGTPPSCIVTLTGSPRSRGTDSYTLEVVAQPAALGTTSRSGNHLTLTAEYLTLRTCTHTGVPTTC